MILFTVGEAMWHGALENAPALTSMGIDLTAGAAAIQFASDTQGCPGIPNFGSAGSNVHSQPPAGGEQVAVEMMDTGAENVEEASEALVCMACIPGGEPAPSQNDKHSISILKEKALALSQQGVTADVVQEALATVIDDNQEALFKDRNSNGNRVAKSIRVLEAGEQEWVLFGFLMCTYSWIFDIKTDEGMKELGFATARRVKRDGKKWAPGYHNFIAPTDKSLSKQVLQFLKQVWPEGTWPDNYLNDPENRSRMLTWHRILQPVANLVEQSINKGMETLQQSGECKVRILEHMTEE